MPYVETRTEVTVTSGEGSKRLDHFLANRDPNFSRTTLQRLILEGHITLNGQVIKPSYKIQPGDKIVLIVPRPEPLDMASEPIPLDVVYEDQAVMVINKQANLVVHPAPGHWSGTLVNALLHHLKNKSTTLSSIGGKERPGLVHRLDKDTTGIMVIAKSDQSHSALAGQFKRHSITRMYEALIWGVPKKLEGRIELAIGRDSKERKKFSSRTARPKESATVYKVKERYGKLAAHVDLFPQTGRTHQLRVHLTALGCPILGDPTYGGKKVSVIGDIHIPRVMLHAKTLGFVHPETQESMNFTAPLPMDMADVVHQLQEATQQAKSES